MVNISETTLAAAAGKVETCHHCLQMSNVVNQVYPALQLPKANFLPKNFEDESFTDDKLTA